jgi:hypothetical protein
MYNTFFFIEKQYFFIDKLIIDFIETNIPLFFQYVIDFIETIIHFFSVRLYPIRLSADGGVHVVDGDAGVDASKVFVFDLLSRLLLQSLYLEPGPRVGPSLHRDPRLLGRPPDPLPAVQDPNRKTASSSSAKIHQTGLTLFFSIV